MPITDMLYKLTFTVFGITMTKLTYPPMMAFCKFLRNTELIV